MDIAEAKSAKTNLEKKIARLLAEFEEETHTEIAGVVIQKALEGPNIFLDSRHIVTIKVVL